MKIKEYLFELTPLGKADKDVRIYLEKRLEDEELKQYNDALKYYRYMKMFQAVLKVFFYASVVTSVATLIGFDQLKFVESVSSYLGTSLIFILYAVTSYVTMIRRESYHVQREILISKAS